MSTFTFDPAPQASESPSPSRALSWEQIPLPLRQIMITTRERLSRMDLPIDMETLFGRINTSRRAQIR